MDKFSYLEPGKPAVFKDRYVTKINECIFPYADGQKGDIGLIGLPLSKTSISASQASEAPRSIRNCLGSYTTFSGSMYMDFNQVRAVDFGDVPIHPTNQEETLHRLHTSVKEMIGKRACERYMMLGGDHGVSYPSIRAFQEMYGRIGVIQWDAHHDVRNFEDGGRTNGTPFRSLIEGGFLKGEDLVQVGIRDFVNAKFYHDYTKQNGVSVYTIGDIDEIGIVNIIKREVERLASVVDIIYLSVDMDVVDQAFAPGCPAVGPGGISGRELLSSISAAAGHEKVIAMDLVEIDPEKDFRDLTSRLAAHAMLRFMYK